MWVLLCDLLKHRGSCCTAIIFERAHACAWTNLHHYRSTVVFQVVWKGDFSHSSVCFLRGGSISDFVLWKKLVPYSMLSLSTYRAAVQTKMKFCNFNLSHGLAIENLSSTLLDARVCLNFKSWARIPMPNHCLISVLCRLTSVQLLWKAYITLESPSNWVEGDQIWRFHCWLSHKIYGNEHQGVTFEKFNHSTIYKSHISYMHCLHWLQQYFSTSSEGDHFIMSLDFHPSFGF